MEKQNKDRKNVRDHLHGKTPSTQRLINNDDGHKKIHNAFQQPMPNWQGQRHMQCQQHQKLQHHQQHQQSYYMAHNEYEDQRGPHQHYYPMQNACCFINGQGQQPERNPDHHHQQQQQQQQQQNKEREWDREFLYPDSSEFIQYREPSGPYKPTDCRHHVQGNRCSHMHMPLPRKAQMHLPLMSHKKEIGSEEAAAGDRLIYKNPKYTDESSVGVNDVADGSEADFLPQTSKEAFKHLDSARALCDAADAHFKEKYIDVDSNRSEDESTTGDSQKSHRSQCTVISERSGVNLRKMVCSQIELQEALNQSLSDLNGIKENIALKFKQFKLTKPSSHAASPDDELPKFQFEENDSQKMKSRAQNVNQPSSTRTSSSSKSSHRTSPVPVVKLQTTPSIEVDFAVSVNDIVAARVISPMMRKIQRMYLNNLREEMAIMEDLENVPQLVSEVYRNAAQQELLKKNSSSSK